MVCDAEMPQCCWTTLIEVMPGLDNLQLFASPCVLASAPAGALGTSLWKKSAAAGRVSIGAPSVARSTWARARPRCWTTSTGSPIWARRRPHGALPGRPGTRASCTSTVPSPAWRCACWSACAPARPTHLGGVGRSSWARTGAKVLACKLSTGCACQDAHAWALGVGRGNWACKTARLVAFTCGVSSLSRLASPDCVRRRSVQELAKLLLLCRLNDRSALGVSTSYACV